MNHHTSVEHEVDDITLMSKIAARDQAALSHLYDRYASRLLGLIVRIVTDRGHADDVLEEVFFELWEKGGRYSASRGSPQTYILMLARSRALDRLRSLKSERRHTTPLQAAAEPAAATAEGLNQLVNTERERIVAQALASLDAPQRAALDLSFFEGKSHSDIAQTLGEPLGTVKSRIRLGMIRLRDALRKRYEGTDTP